MSKQVKVVKGPSATGEKFGFRVNAKTRIEVGEKPVTVAADVAEGYVSTGHLEIVESATKTTAKAETKNQDAPEKG